MAEFIRFSNTASLPTTYVYMQERGQTTDILQTLLCANFFPSKFTRRLQNYVRHNNFYAVWTNSYTQFLPAVCNRPIEFGRKLLFCMIVPILYYSDPCRSFDQLRILPHTLPYSLHPSTGFSIFFNKIYFLNYSLAASALLYGIDQLSKAWYTIYFYDIRLSFSLRMLSLPIVDIPRPSIVCSDSTRNSAEHSAIIRTVDGTT